MTPDFDVAIIGSGPAGSSAAAALARAGKRVALFEAESFPRFHIGESLLPVSNRAFRRLGIYEKVRDHGFMEKWGALFYDENGDHESIFDFSNLLAQDGLGKIPTYEVPRAEFDHLLLTHAVEQGAQLIQERVREVKVLPDRVEIDGKTAHCVIDASGRAGVVAKPMDVRRMDPELQKAAVYAHFENVPLPEGKHRGSIRIISNSHMDWVWMIPLSETRVSVGVVTSLPRLQKIKRATPEETFAALMDDVPYVKGLIAGARRDSEVRVESSFSYTTSAYAGPRWFLIGDAGSFLDPVFSSGVLFALLGGLDVSDTVQTCLRDNRWDKSYYRAYDAEQKRRYRFVRKFVVGFYRPEFRDLFYKPTKRMGLVQSVLRVLAGFWQPNLMERCRLQIFFACAAAQRRLSLVPRLHPQA